MSKIIINIKVGQAETARIYAFLPIPVPINPDQLPAELRTRFGRAPKKLEVLRHTLNELHDKNEVHLGTIASKARCSVRHVQRVHEELKDLGLLNWALRYMKASVFKVSTWFYLPEVKSWFRSWLYNNLELLRLLYVKPPDRLLINKISPTIKTWFFNHPKHALSRDVMLLIFKELILLTVRSVSGTPPPTFGECIVKNNRRPEITGSIQRSGYEATTQKHPRLRSPQKRKDHGTIQPNTTVHSGDRRDSTYKVGTDQADGVPGSGDRRCPQSPKTQQSGWQSIRSLFQGSAGLLQSQQPGNTVEESRLPERDVQDAGECPDDIVWGYEEAYAEVYD